MGLCNKRTAFCFLIQFFSQSIRHVLSRGITENIKENIIHRELRAKNAVCLFVCSNYNPVIWLKI